MTPTKAYEDTRLRKYALNNLRDILDRLRAADGPTPTGSAVAEPNWRQGQLQKATQWATIAEALRPDPPRYTNVFRGDGS